MAFSDLFNWVVESKGELDSVLSVATAHLPEPQAEHVTQTLINDTACHFSLPETT